MLEINYSFLNSCSQNWEECGVEFYAHAMSDNSIGAAATAMLLNGMDTPKTDKVGRVKLEAESEITKKFMI